MGDFSKILSGINIFDIIFLILMIYFIVQCFLKGFSLSFISFMKWVFALVVTIVLVPKLQPWVNNYIESEFNDLMLGNDFEDLFNFQKFKVFLKSARDEND